MRHPFTPLDPLSAHAPFPAQAGVRLLPAAHVPFVFDWLPVVSRSWWFSSTLTVMFGSGGSATRGRVFVVGLAVLPLVVLPDASLGGESVFLVPKLMWLGVVVVPAALALARRSGVRVRALWAPALLVAWMFLATLSHTDPWRSLAGRIERYDGALAHAGLLACALGGAALAAQDGRRSLGTALAWSGLSVSLVSVAQRIGVVPSLATQQKSILLVDMPGSLIGNRGYTACFIAAMLPFVMERGLTTRGRRRVAWSASVAICALGIGLGWTRGASLAAIVAALAFAAMSRGTRPRAVALAAIAGLGLLLGTLSVPNEDGVSAGRSFSSSDSGRGVLYRASVAGISDHPVFGLGAGGVLRALFDVPPATVLRWAHVDATNARIEPASDPGHLIITGTSVDGSEIRYENITTKTHNELLDYAVSFGLPAAFLAALTFGLALLRARRDAALFASLVGAAVGLATWPQVMRTAPVLWAVLGLALSLRKPPSPTTQQLVEHQFSDLADRREFVPCDVEHFRREERLDPLRSSLETDDQRNGVAELRGEHDLDEFALAVEVGDRTEERSDIEHAGECLLGEAVQRNRVAIDEPRLIAALDRRA